MADRSLRGMRLGAQSLQSEEGVVYSPRSRYTYLCTVCGQESEVVFSAEAEAPDTWECKHCGHEARLLVGDIPVEVDHSDAKVPRSHWDMLLERRSRAELEELLEERLQYLRSRRGTSERKHSA
ncbi:RNA polymerase-binding protein RbpA [Leifsonia sp. 2MCAF36]|uniref:RNA polymerase-binding protein RbpA n=1 Tax=Leifsonia sp. 2MCAF36 TaxID=3232988 RepID=UPI003F9C0F11